MTFKEAENNFRNILTQQLRINGQIFIKSITPELVDSIMEALSICAKNEKQEIPKHEQYGLRADNIRIDEWIPNKGAPEPRED